MLADARAATAPALPFSAVVLADARAATALALPSSAVVLADARAAKLSACVRCAIVGALFAESGHLQGALCFLLLLDETSKHSLPLRQAGRSFLYSVHKPESAGSLMKYEFVTRSIPTLCKGCYVR